MEWIKFSERKPETEVTALVTNYKCPMLIVKALYNSYNDIWTEFNPQAYNHFPLEVTHWIPLPEPVKKD